MPLLDSYDEHVSQYCKNLEQQNSTFEKISEKLGVGTITKGIEEFIGNGVVNSLTNSPLRVLGEDVLASTITDNARRLSQNVLNQVPSKLTNTLTDIRSAAFNSVFTVMTIKNDMILYFASVVAEQCVEAIREKRKNLIALQESVRQLHNALLALAGGGPFFNKYLAELRRALAIIDDAENQLFLVQSAFYTQNFFSSSNYENAKELLQEAYELLLPPVTGPEAEQLKEGFLKNVLSAPEYETQLAMLMNIPKLAFNMLKQYDLYALKVLKVNVFLLGFQNIVQDLTEVTGGKFKDLIIDQIQNTRDFLQSLITDMALQINGPNPDPDGGPLILRSKDSFYTPNPTKTSAKAVTYGVRVKAAQVMLELIDSNAMKKLNVSNSALKHYYAALEKLSKLDNITSSTAVLKATDGREEPGQIEGDMIVLAFQANQAIVDSSRLVDVQAAGFESKSVLSLGAKINSFFQMAIDRDREIEKILLTYIGNAAPLLQGVRDTGDSIFKMLDSLGMDRAGDFLKKGMIGDFFEMNGQTATYIGAGVAGLSFVLAAVDTESQKQCIENAIEELKIDDTTKKLEAQRTVGRSLPRLQAANETKCKERKDRKKKVEGCSSQIDPRELRTNPKKALSGLFGGIFGGNVPEGLEGTFGSFAGGAFETSNKGIGNLDISASSATGVFTSGKAAELAAKDGLNAMASAESEAKQKLSDTINKIGGPVKADPSESMERLSNKLKSVKGNAPANLQAQIEDAEASVGIFDSMKKEASDLLNNVDAVKSKLPFGKDLPTSLDITEITKSLPSDLGGLTGGSTGGITGGILT